MHVPPHLTNVGPTPHGDLNYLELAQLNLQPEQISDFSANSNPYGAHPLVLEVISQNVTAKSLLRYPDRHCLALRQAIAEAEQISPDQILPGNGANELIQVIALALVSSGSRNLILSPTFGEYNRAIAVMQGNTLAYRAPSPLFRFDVSQVAALIRGLQLNSIWLCNPNNPTGQYLSENEIALIQEAAGEETIIVIDESYKNFVRSPSTWLAINNHPLTIVLRSLTKEHGLAGIRLGYLIANPMIIDLLQAVQPAWSVNSLAQVAGVAALHPKVVEEQRQNIASLRRHAATLWAKLKAAGYDVLPTSTTYALVKVGSAVRLRRHLLSHGLLVRNATSFGLPYHVRIASQLPDQNEQLIAAMREIRAG